PASGADFACANLQFEGGASNPIAAALPAFVCLPLDKIDGAEAVLSLLFEEAFEHRCGRQALLDRLFEVVLIQVLRQLMERQQTQVGMLAGLAHPKLRAALAAMHGHPANEWSLESLAERAGMSRSIFATSFREHVGCTPGAYLQRWRIGLAQQALKKGRPL
ncbi:cupin domain-containing protein, partial [Lysobacter sp. D1-1-M9]|uniref:cupin domain-containing protein n=1 Tax=Novilysobacter longmucuonensis TaxID=3098603 RepID=UPI002FC8F17F